jgi:hypothetical protein
VLQVFQACSLPCLSSGADARGLIIEAWRERPVCGRTWRSDRVKDSTPTMVAVSEQESTSFSFCVEPEKRDLWAA